MKFINIFVFGKNMFKKNYNVAVAEYGERL